jgi:hypothetical protein
MRSKTLMLFAARAFVAALVTVVPLSAQSQTLTPFDPTGSTFTNPVSINATETITGFYSDAAFLNHGFLRAADGTITTFDAPGAAQGTFPQQINPGGDHRKLRRGDLCYSRLPPCRRRQLHHV